jgi:hypothetical protein
MLVLQLPAPNFTCLHTACLPCSLLRCPACQPCVSVCSDLAMRLLLAVLGSTLLCCSRPVGERVGPHAAPAAFDHAAGAATADALLLPALSLPPGPPSALRAKRLPRARLVPLLLLLLLASTRLCRLHPAGK